MDTTLLSKVGNLPGVGTPPGIGQLPGGIGEVGNGVGDINKFLQDVQAGKVSISARDKAAMAAFLEAQAKAARQAAIDRAQEASFFKSLEDYSKTTDETSTENTYGVDNTSTSPQFQEYYKGVEKNNNEIVDSAMNTIKTSLDPVTMINKKGDVLSKIGDVAGYVLAPLKLGLNAVNLLWNKGATEIEKEGQIGKPQAEVDAYYAKKLANKKIEEENNNIKQEVEKQKQLASDTAGLTPLYDELKKKEDVVVPAINAVNDYYANFSEIQKNADKLNKEMQDAYNSGDTAKQEEIANKGEALNVDALKTRIKLVEGTDVVGESEQEIMDNMRSIYGEKLTNDQIKSVITKKEAAQIEKAVKLNDEYHAIQTDYNIKSDMNIGELTLKSWKGTVDAIGIPVVDSERDIVRGLVYGRNPEELKWAKENGKEMEARIGMSIYNSLVNDLFTKSYIGEYRTGDKTLMGFEQFKSVLSTKEFQDIQPTILYMTRDAKYYDETGNFQYAKFWNDFANTNIAEKYTQKFGEIYQQNNLDRRLINAEEQTLVGKALTYAGWGISQTKDIPLLGLNWYLEKATEITGQPGIVALINPYTMVEAAIGAPAKKVNLGIFGKQYSHADLLDDVATETKSQDITYQQNPMSTLSDTLRTFYHKINADPAGTIMAIAPLFVGSPFSTATKIPGLITDIANPGTRKLLGTLYDLGTTGVGEGTLRQLSFEQINSVKKSEPWAYGINVIPAAFKAFQWFKKSTDFRGDFQLMAKGIEKDLVSAGYKVGSKKYNEAFTATMQKTRGPILGTTYKSEDIAKETQKLIDEGFDMASKEGIIELEARMKNYAGDSVANYVRTSPNGVVEFDLKGLARQVETTLAKNAPNSAGYLVQAQTKYLEKIIAEGKLQRSEIKFINEGFQHTTPELYAQVLKKYTVGGKVDEVAIAAEFLANNQNTAQKMAEYGFAKAYNFTADSAGILEPITKKYNDIKKAIDVALKTATPEQKAILNATSKGLNSRYSKMSIIPLAFVKGVGPERIAPLQAQFDKIISVLQGTGVNTTKLGGKLEKLVMLPADVMRLQGKPQELAQLFLGKKDYELKALGVKIYSPEEFMIANNKFLAKTLSKQELKNLENVMESIAAIDNGSVLIYQIPDNVKKQVLSQIMGFTTFVEKGGKQNVVVGIMGGLMDIAGNTSKLSKVNNLEYLRVVTHELGHNVMLSLRGEVRAQLVENTMKLFANVKTEKDISEITKIILPNINAERLKFLDSITDERQFFEEVSADLMSDALQSRIFGREGDVKKIGDKMYDMALKGKLDGVVITDEGNYELIASRFWKSMVGVSRAMGKTSDVEQLRNTMYFIADNIVEGQRMFTVEGKAAKQLNTLKFLTKEGKPLVNGGAIIKSQATKAAYAQAGGKISTLKQGITSFDIAKVYSEGIVRGMVRDTAVDAAQLGQVLSLNFGESLAKRNILAGASATEVKKYNDALKFMEDKHNIALRNMQEFFDGKNIDLTKIVDGKSFFETLKNVGTRITKQGVVEFAGQDLMKFLNISDEKVYQNVLKSYIDTLTAKYAPDVILDVNKAFDAMGITTGSLGERYAEFSKKVQDIIAKAAADGGVDINLAKDITSRLFVGGPGYISVIAKNLKRIEADGLVFMEELARGITKKNSYRGNAEIFGQDYASILKNINYKGEEATAMSIAENFGRDMDLQEGQIQWQSYTKEFYNALSARSEDFIINALQKQGLKSISMDTNNFAQYINKISGKSNMYDNIVQAKFEQMGILDDLDRTFFADAYTTEEIMKLYKEQLLANKKNIVIRVGEDGYVEAQNYIDTLLEKGISASDSKMLLDKYNTDFITYADGLSAENYFNDITNVKDTEKLWENRMLDFKRANLGADTPDYTIAIMNAVGPEGQAAVSETLGLLTEYNNITKEIVSEGFDGAFNKLFENSYLKPFFNVESKGYKITANKILNRYGTSFDLEFSDVQNKQKGNWMTDFIGRFVNTATVAEKDLEISGVVNNAIQKMSEGQFIFKDSSLEKYLSNIGALKAGQNIISTKTFVRTFVKQMTKYAKKDGLTYAGLSNDILGAYIRRNFDKLGGLDNLAVQGDENYRLLVDAYVDLLSRREKQGLGLFDESYTTEVGAMVNGKPKMNKVYAGGLKKQLDNIGKAFDNNGLKFGSKGSNEIDKMLGLGGSWVGMKSADIKKLSDKAEIYYDRMFDNFLYNSMAKSHSIVKRYDRFGRAAAGIEGFAANAQYALFYNLFAGGAGISAGTQQILSNKFHSLGKIASELGDMNVDNINELMKMTETILPYNVLKSIRPEFYQQTNKINKAIQDGMTWSSSLTWADDAIKTDVERYAFMSALKQHGYTSQGAESLIAGASMTQKAFEAKGYGKYFSNDAKKQFNNFLMRSEDNVMKGVSYKIEKEVSMGTLTRAQADDILRDISSYKTELAPLKQIVEDSRIKTMTFFQMSNASNPELVQNYIGGWAGAANMRFMNRASRKTGEYAFSMAEALLHKDYPAMGKILNQLSTEFVMAQKFSMALNSISEGDALGGSVNNERFLSSVFLPYTLLNMMTFKVMPILGDIVMAGWNNMATYDETQLQTEKRIAEAGGTFAQNMKADMNNILTTGKGRIGASVVYWATQYGKIANGLAMLNDKGDRDAVYSTIFSGVPFIRVFAEMAANIMQGRVSKFDTMTIGSVNRDYVNASTTDSFISFLMNAKISKSILQQDKMVSSFYDMNIAKDNGFTASFQLLPFSRDQKFALRARDQYYKDNGLGNFIYGGTKIGEALKALNDMSTNETIIANIKALGLDPEKYKTIVNAGMSADIADIYSEENLTQTQIEDLLKKTAPKTSKVWNSIMGQVKMNGGVDEKGLLFAGAGLTDAETMKFDTKRQELKDKIKEEIAGTNPALIKAAAYNEQVWSQDIRDGLNQYGQQMRIGVILDGMAAANRELFKQSLIDKNGKGRWTTEGKKQTILDLITENDTRYKMELLKNNYNTLLQGNRNIGKNLAVMYFNTDPAKPLVKQLSENVGLGTVIIPNLIQKTVEAQGLSALGTDNIFATLNRQMWYNAGSIKDEAQKAEYMKRLFGYKAAVLDYASKFGNGLMATNVKVGIIASDIPHLEEIKLQSPELFNMMIPEVKDYLDRFTVSEPLTDEKILENVRADLFKTPGTGSGRRGSIPAFKDLNMKLNKFGDFKTDFYRYALKTEPYEQVRYSFDGNGKLTPLRESALEARPPNAKYDFLKLAAPESLKTPDITVQTIKTTRTSKYTGKSIKGGNVYTVKTSRGVKR